jgi:hypothetical protein
MSYFIVFEDFGYLCLACRTLKWVRNYQWPVKVMLVKSP